MNIPKLDYLLNYVNKNSSGIMSGAIQSNDALGVSEKGSLNGKIEYVDSYNSTLANAPMNKMIALKVQYFKNGSGVVVLYEIYPYAGNIWMNKYINSSWRGWKLCAGSITLYTGSTTQGNSIGQNSEQGVINLDAFGSFDVVANGTKINCPVDDNNICWGSAITVGGSSERYLCTVKLTLNKSNNQFSCNVCSQLSYPSTNPTNMTLTKIIGRP